MTRKLDKSKTTTQKRVALTLQDKAEIVRQVCKDHAQQNVVAQKYRVNKATISTVVKEQEKYMSAYDEGGISTKRQKLRLCNFEELDNLRGISARNLRRTG